MNSYIIPIVVLLIISYAYVKKCDIYNLFIEGTIDGLKIFYTIIPSIFAMFFAIDIFLESGVLDFLMLPFSKLFKFPIEILSLAFLKPISGTSTLVILNNIFTKYGVDSYFGFLSSIIQGCTDTTIYVLALYFGSIGIVKTRYTLFVCLMADLVGIFIAFIVSTIFY